MRPGPTDGEVVLAFGVEERVAPVIVAVVLVRGPDSVWPVGLGRVVCAAVVAGGFARLGESAARMVQPRER